MENKTKNTKTKSSTTTKRTTSSTPKKVSTNSTPKRVSTNSTPKKVTTPSPTVVNNIHNNSVLYNRPAYSQNNTINRPNNTINRPIVKKKKKTNYYYYGNIILIILLLLILIFIFKSCGKKEEEPIDNEINIEKKYEENKDKYPEEINNKLKELKYINEKITFFKMDYLDRYIEYKNNNSDLDIEKVIVYVNIGLDQEYYTNIQESPNKHTNTVLVNKYNYLGDDYKPTNLTNINKNYSIDEKYMEESAALAFNTMAKDAKDEGFTIKAVSTYRSYSYQTGLYNRYKEQDGQKKADTYSARPGYSEHQTGLAVDVSNGKVSYTSFGDTKEFKWMQDNAYKYGFILRYTKETEFITGYVNEPWHYRYVGNEIATYIHNNPMTYEEYYVRFLEN